jgi:hypothetical protein
MKGVETTKGVWAGSGKSGRKARTVVKKRVRKIGRKKLADQHKEGNQNE